MRTTAIFRLRKATKLNDLELRSSHLPMSLPKTAILLTMMSVRNTPDVPPLDAPPIARYKPVTCVKKLRVVSSNEEYGSSSVEFSDGQTRFYLHTVARLHPIHEVLIKDDVHRTGKLPEWCSLRHFLQSSHKVDIQVTKA